MNTIRLEGFTKDALIAGTPDEYVSLAVRLANDDALRVSVEADIRESVKNIFY